jgi:DNA uptake protein ComE-like DNA-binding protein
MRDMQNRMKQYPQLFALMPGLSLAACAGASAPDTATATSALTTDDVDVAPECYGIIEYTNGASRAELDQVLPSNVASAVAARRAQRPFLDLADISSVPGIAQARLEAITARAYTLAFIDAECAGVYEEIAVSHDDRDAILEFVNTASLADLTAVARFQPATVGPALVAGRPYTTLQQLVDIYGVGTDTFRSIRNAAIASPIDDLVTRVNNARRGEAAMSLNFDWFDVMANMPGRPAQQECFGIAPATVAEFGGSVRADLADAAEVLAEVQRTVAYANRSNEVGDATAGLADLARQIDGQTFFGCYQGFRPDPWSGVTQTFFVNTVTGYRVLTQRRWSE